MEQQKQQPIQEETDIKPPFKSNWKFLAIAVVFSLVVGGGILWYVSLPQPEIQPTNFSIPPKPKNEVLDTSTWQTYRNEKLGFELKYPSHWKSEEGYFSNGKRYSGEDGFLQFSAIEEFAEGIDEISQYEAYFDEPYGSNPLIENLEVGGQEARLILPSSDQSKDMKNRAALIIRYPKPIIIKEVRYPYLDLLVDADHIRQILSTFRFVE